MPIDMPWWKRYVDDVISIVKNEQVDTLFNHLISVDALIKFTMKPMAMMVEFHSWITNVLSVPTIQLLIYQITH